MSDINAVYTERAHLVAALSKLFPASLEDHIPAEGEAWDEDWTTVVLIDLPTGQASWHVARWDLHLFAHLKRGQGRVWDGHSTPEKYARLDALTGYWAWPNPELTAHLPEDVFRKSRR